MSEGALRAKVQDYLRKSRALEAVWHRPVTATQLQAELDRMVRHTNDGRMLRELFAALGDDPYVIAETLARQSLVDRLIRGAYDGDAEKKIPFDSWWEREHLGFDAAPASGSFSYTLAAVPTAACVPESWTSTGANVPDGRRYHVSVWTGAEMIVFGGDDGSTVQATGGRYDRRPTRGRT
jgi:hypothetical protein